MNKMLLSIVFTIMMSIRLLSQVVSIGNQTLDDGNVPINPYYKYSYSQCLYLASEINESGNIYRLTYKGKPGLSISKSNDWTIYMGHTSANVLTNNNWIPTTNMTQVFSGNISVENNNVVITLTTPFNYNGTDNLVIAVDENQDGYDDNSDDFYTSNVSSLRSLYYRNDNNNPNPDSPPTSIGDTKIANIDIDFNSTPCGIPYEVAANNVGKFNADISWESEASISAWQLEYGNKGFALGNGTIINTSDKNHSLTGLNAFTEYDVYVRSNCGSGTGASVGPYTFRTLCDNYSTPYFEGFENGYNHYESIGNCLSQEDINGAGKWVANNNLQTFNRKPRTGVWSSYIGEAGNNDWLFIPINLTSGVSYTVELYAKHSASSGNKISIKYGTQAVSAEMTNEIVPETNITNGNYQKVKGTFTPTSTGVFQVGIYGITTTTGYMSIDDIKIYETPSCIEPENITISNVLTNSAKISWQAQNNESAWKIEYGEVGFNQGEGTMVNVTTNPYTLSGISSNTNYEFYIQADCGNSDSSFWSGPYQFTTLCSTISEFPYTEEFEGITTGQPNCWGISGTTTTANMHWYSFATGYNGRGLKFNSYNNSLGNTSELTTPKLNLTSLTTPTLSFYYRNPAGGELEVLVSKDGGASYEVVASGLTNQSTWKEKIINLTDYSSSNTVVMFKGTSNYGSNGAYIYLDAIKIEEAPSCLKPYDVTINGINSNTATINWESISNTSSWVIEYGESGFTQGQGTSINTTHQPHTITGLSESTTYDIYVKANCTGGEESAWSDSASFSTTCNPYSIPYFEGFENGYTNSGTIGGCILQENLEGSSQWNTKQSTTSAKAGTWNAYLFGANLDWMFIPVQLTAGTSYTAELFANKTTAGSKKVIIKYGTEASKSAMDFNIAPQTEITGDGYQKIKGSFTPNSTGTYFIGIFGESSTSGSIYIDNIKVYETPSCVEPNNVNISDIFSNSAKITWDAVNGETAWKIEYGEEGFTQGSGSIVNVTTNPYTLSGLSGNTKYDFYIQSDCGNGDTSFWSGPYQFETLCNTVTAFPYVETFNSTNHRHPDCWGVTGTTTAPDKHWYSYAFGYDGRAIRFNSTYGNPAGRTSELTTPTLDVTSLTSAEVKFFFQNPKGVAFEIQVSSDGGANYTTILSESGQIQTEWVERAISIQDYSSSNVIVKFKGTSNAGDTDSYIYLDEVMIRETPTCPKPQNLNTTNITEISADLSWTAGGSETLWNIEYGTKGFTQGTGTVIQANSNPFTLTGLSHSNAYEYYVQAHCGEGDDSVWVGPFEFATSCSTVTNFPFIENFDNLTEGRPVCWEVSGTTSNDAYHWNSHQEGNNGTRGIRFNSYNNSANRTSELITPAIDLSSLSTAKLSFDFKNPSGGNFEILISQDGGANYTSLASGLTGQENWTNKTYDISNYISSNVKIMFKGTSNYGYGNAYIYLDNININEGTLSTIDLKKESFSYYPNPVVNTLYITTQSKIEGVRIVNASGQVVHTASYDKRKVEINTSHLVSGVYFVEVIQSNNQIENFKIIKK